MSDRSWAKLTIGGEVGRADLLQAVADYGTSTAFRALNRGELDDDGHVVVESDDASGGGFSELEAWLEERGVAFDLLNGACAGAWPAMRTHFRPHQDVGPDGRGRTELVVNDDDEEVVTVSALLDAMTDFDTLDELRAWLDREFPTIDPLPPITWQ